MRDNREKLKMSTQLPHMVANVGEILEPEEEDAGDKDGTGFQVKKVGGMDKKD